MQQFILNIGLDSQATGAIAAHVAEQIVAANNFRIVRTAVHQSDTEQTLVAEIQCFDMPFLAWQQFVQIARDLRQDCIAIYNPATGTGALAGLRAQAWGEFNPEFFLLLDGSRLSSTLQRAA